MYSVRPVGQSEFRPISRGLLIAPRIKKNSQYCLTQSRNSSSDLRSDSAISVQSVADESLTLADIERMFAQNVEDKKDDLKAAFQAFDLEGNSTVTKGEFRRVIEHFLINLTQAQFEMLLIKVPKRANGSVAYMEFLRKYCKISSAKPRIHNMCQNQQNQGFGELQCNLKDKIGCNLKNVTRAFRLFDFNLDGQIQQHEFRRILEAYCCPLSDHDFQRLWSHYSAGNTDTLFYKEFLERLGVDCENYHKIKPDNINQALNWDVCEKRRANRSIKTAWAATDRNGDNLDEIHAKFLKKMSMNYNLVEKALHAFDITGSGLISPEDLKSILSNFILPMNERIFHGLFNRFGIKATEPVSWKQFLALFQNGEQPLADRKWNATVIPEQSSVEEILPKLQLHVQEVGPLLSRAFRIFDEGKTGVLPWGELRRVVEGLTFHLTDEQFKGFVDLLDPECSGVIDYNQFIDLCQSHTKSGPMPSAQPQQAVCGVQEISKERSSSRVSSENDHAPMSSIAADTRMAVETILRDRLSGKLDTVLNHLDQLDHTRNGTVSVVDLKRVVQQYGLPVSDSHFEKLCSDLKDSGRISYKQFLRGLGIRNINYKDNNTHDSRSLFQRTGSAYRAHYMKLKKQALQDVVLRKLKDGLDERGISVHDCLRMSRGGPKSVLTIADFTKILDDCRIMLDKQQIQTLTQALGFRSGQITHFDFVSKFEKSTAQMDDEPEGLELKSSSSSLITAEECLKQLKKRITEFHGNALSAFRMMDKNRDGVVNWRDFRVLFDSLQLVIKEKEYQRLLDLMGLQNGATLNYAEFFDLVHRSSQAEAAVLCAKKSGSGEPCDSVGQPSRPDQWLDLACEQIHTHLVEDIRHRWAFISKDLCHFNEDGESIIHKVDLKHLLFKYSLPITTRDFEKLWMRYDKSGRGYLTQSEFFEALHIVPEGQDLPLDPPTEGEQDAQLEQHMDRKTSSLCSDVISQDLRCTGQSPQDSEELSPDRALQRIREVVTDTSEHLQKAFSAFDKTASGLVSSLEFRQVLDHFCFRLSDRQFNHLLMKLKGNQEGHSMVDWRLFLQTFQFNWKETAEEWLEKLEKVHFPSQARPLVINEILERIKDVVSTRLYVITKEMVSLDYAHINVISKQDFKQICDKHFMRLTSEQFDDLWNILPVNAYGNLDIHKFLAKFSENQELDDLVSQEGQGSTSPTPVAPESKTGTLKRPKTASSTIKSNKTAEVPKQTKRPHSAGTKTVPSLNGEAVNRKVGCQIHSCWKTIQRRCRESDPDRLGEIGAGTFLGIMGELQIQMTPLEFEQLTAKYQVKSNGHIRYSDFLRHFVLPHRPPVTSLLSRNNLHLPKMPSNAGALSSQCMEAMLRIYGPVQQFWRSMRQSFVSFDKDRSKKISVQDFRKVLRHYSVTLSEEEFFHISSVFDKDMSGKISYNEFLSTFLL